MRLGLSKSVATAMSTQMTQFPVTQWANTQLLLPLLINDSSNKLVAVLQKLQINPKLSGVITTSLTHFFKLSLPDQLALFTRLQSNQSPLGKLPVPFTDETITALKLVFEQLNTISLKKLDDIMSLLGLSKDGLSSNPVAFSDLDDIWGAVKKQREKYKEMQKLGDG